MPILMPQRPEANGPAARQIRPMAAVAGPPRVFPPAVTVTAREVIDPDSGQVKFLLTNSGGLTIPQATVDQMMPHVCRRLQAAQAEAAEQNRPIPHSVIFKLSGGFLGGN
jgi:hypothetical protein